MTETVQAKARRLISTDCVRILWQTDQHTAARVRSDHSGVVDVRWSHLNGWSCSCPGMRPGCSHEWAVRNLTAKSAKT